MSDAAETVPETAGERIVAAQPAPAATHTTVTKPARDQQQPATPETQSACNRNDTIPCQPGHSIDNTAEARRPDVHAGLRRSDQLVIGVLSIAACLLIAVHWLRLSGWGMQPVEIERLPSRRYDFRIDVNRATWVEWIQLEGIGEALAHRIITDREQNGPFESIDDLQRVKGVGPKTVERIRPWLSVPPQADRPRSPAGKGTP